MALCTLYKEPYLAESFEYKCLLILQKNANYTMFDSTAYAPKLRIYEESQDKSLSV